MSRYIVYHVGNLARDRENDPTLNISADLYLQRGTPLGVPTHPALGDDSPRGLGEGTLHQVRLWEGVYEYRFYPNRPCGV